MTNTALFYITSRGNVNKNHIEKLDQATKVINELRLMNFADLRNICLL